MLDSNQELFENVLPESLVELDDLLEGGVALIIEVIGQRVRRLGLQRPQLELTDREHPLGKTVFLASVALREPIELFVIVHGYCEGFWDVQLEFGLVIAAFGDGNVVL